MQNVNCYIKKYIIILILLVNSFNLLATKIDSLNLKLSQTKQDTSKIIIYVSYLKQNSNISENKKDSIYNNLLILADKLYKNYLNDTTKNKNLIKFFAVTYTKVSDYYFYDKSDYKKSLEIYKKRLELYKYLNNKKELSKVYNEIGNIYKFKSDYEKALNYYQKALDLKKATGNRVGEAYTHIGIANVFINWGKYKDGLKHYEICNKICEQEHDTIGIAAAVTGLGNIYYQTNNIAKALKYHKKAYKLYYAINNKEGIALSLLNIGEIYKETKEYDKAIKSYNDALKIAIKIDAKIRIALIYSLIADVYVNMQDYKKAIKFYNLSLPIAKEIDYKKIIVTDYKGLALSNKNIGEYNYAYNYLDSYYLLKDSIFNKEKHKQLAEIETKYKTVQKEKIIKQQKYKLEKDRILTEKRTYQLIFILSFLILIIVVMVFVIRSYRQKQKANKLLAKQNKEITAQRDEIEHQKEKIEEIHHEVSESINYATRLQSAILPEEKLLKKYLSDHFVLFKPKDKVSGDFYWWAHIENHTIITAADCTGHGVPGAFMSMLGTSFLREIVQKEYVTHTGVILRKLRKEIIKALKQTGESGEQKDGMDMAIISIDHETNTVQFSGANNPLYIIKDEELKIKDESNNTVKLFDNSKLRIKNSKFLYEIKPDKMPIAIYEKMDNFTTHEIQFQKGDQLYMFSDGFADQFGGPKGKKFKYKPFKRLLLENADKPMAEQKAILEKTFVNWKGDLEQIDDVTVIGIKI